MLGGVLALLTLGFAVPAPAAPVALNDGAARAHLEQMELSGTLADPHWANAYWARARTAPTEQARIADLRWALRFDENLNRARWDLAMALLRTRDAEFADQIVRTVTHAAASFPTQQRLAFVTLTLLLGAMTLTLVVLTTLAYAKTVPRIRHGIGERLDFLPAEVRTGASLLTIALPFLVALTLPPTAALFWMTAYGVAGAWVWLDRWERRTGVTCLVALLVAPLILSLWVQFLTPSLPGSYLRSLWASQAAQDRTAAAALQSATARVGEDADHLASLALIDRRAGRLVSARQRLQRAIQIEPENWAHHNNLGNVQLLDGDGTAALASYQRASKLAPNEPLPHVNLAQAWMQKIEFNRADEAIARATELGYHLPKLMTTDPRNVVVRDETLSASALWSRFGEAETDNAAVTWRRAGEMTLGLLFPLRPFFLSLPLFVAVFWMVQTRSLPRVFECAGCSTRVCRKCHYRVNRRSYCGSCYSILREVRAPLKRAEMMRERRLRVRKLVRPGILAVAVMLPGVGHLMYGARKRAVVFLGATALLAMWAAEGVLWADPWANPLTAVGVSKWIAAVLLWAGLGYLSARGTIDLAEKSDELPPESKPQPKPEPRSA